MVSTPLLATINILGGLIFGYNTGIVAAALPLIEVVFSLSPVMKGLFSASILFGAMMGSLFGGAYGDKFGRKATIITLSLFSSVGAVATALSPSLLIMVLARVVCGVGVGLATVACPTYVAENAPFEKKGTLGTFFQLAITFGIFVSYLIGLLKVDYAYRWMFAIGALPGVACLLVGIFMRESPSWLSKKVTERDPLLSKVLQIQSNRKEGRMLDLFVGPARKSLVIGLLLATAQQLTGINAVMYYAPSMFLAANIKNPILPTIGVGFWNFLTTFIATFLVDRLGRRPLILASVYSMTLSSLSLALTYQFAHDTALGVCSIIFLLSFVAGFETGEGPLFWLVCIELFDDDVKGSALSFLNATTWVFNLILTFAFPPLEEAIGQNGVFWIFGGIGLVSGVLMYFVLPETKRVQVVADEYK